MEKERVHNTSTKNSHPQHIHPRSGSKVRVGIGGREMAGNKRNVGEHGGNSSRERGAQPGSGGRPFQGRGWSVRLRLPFEEKERVRESVVVAVSCRSSYGALLLGLVVAPPPPLPRRVSGPRARTADTIAVPQSTLRVPTIHAPSRFFFF